MFAIFFKILEFYKRFSTIRINVLYALPANELDPADCARLLLETRVLDGHMALLGRR
jgi:hypothetical protein